MIYDLEEQILSTCRFCNPPEKERILYDGRHFYVMLSLGPLVEGYVLLVAKEHLSTCAEIPEPMVQEFDYLYTQIHEILSLQYGHCISYEHGRSGSCLILTEGSKHCYHAHMHFVPVQIPLNEIVQRDFDHISVNDLNKFRAVCLQGNIPYLFVDDGHLAIYPIKEVIRRQYLRFKVGQYIEQPEKWDWVKHQGWDTILAGKQVLQKYYNKITPFYD